ncbi:peptide deformylase [Agrococcus sediminis]|jgi:peptide deformylase|uniref:Peptide deformylase n=1 Tax=Agrococcus sediminis TaxID=2599924 RepID=A0A5M8QG17_9MICO|nr:MULTISPECIES: peptide deformylase [Agrococcus]KAA6433853.1 peptide deformylase [Agrococcus sediminis]RWR25547.1 peptide deformylase [Agrococcus lahaulensis]UOW00617.1 peptide deformylase [Agrococcus sp. SCSIO52902]
MTVLPICITGEPVLHRVADPVRAFDDELAALVADMFATMEAAPGVGLAAPQIGLAKRLFVYDWTDADGVRTRGVAANPELWISPLPVGLPDEDDEEGCLSIPGERFALLRAERALLRAQDERGEHYELEASGWLARILQHEFDHLNGILYADRLDAFGTKGVQKAIKRNKWGVEGLTWMPGEDDLEG